MLQQDTPGCRPRPRPVAVRHAGLACLALAVAGCHLVDQRDFNPSAGLPPAKPAPPPAPPPPPSLLTIRYTTPEPQYRDALAAVVQKAIARKRDVLFTVTTIVPAGAPPDEAISSGREVAQAIVDDGAEAGQVEQAVRLDPAAPVKIVSVNVH